MIIRSRRFRSALALFAMVAPGFLRRFVHTRLLGYRIDPTAVIGRSFIDVDRFEMGPGAAIGHLNVIRGLEDLWMAEASRIAHLNWINSVRRDKGFFEDVDRHLALIMGYNTSITIMHFIDCCAKVELVSRSVLAGYWTQVMTHTFDYRTARQDARPITIGERSIITTRCTLLPGVKIAERSIVAAGSVVHGQCRKPGFLYAGVPAKPVRELDFSQLFLTDELTIR
ncbi:hypothetical protein WCD74_01400 [Actinomycetospora sp. OC33-EN08]|uniref:Acyltransferase n=1 Tax=Actinomycetospora aurantiaca TaxID=3129233 RepID=A0ABU8MIC2_9PSEU